MLFTAGMLFTDTETVPELTLESTVNLLLLLSVTIFPFIATLAIPSPILYPLISISSPS